MLFFILFIIWLVTFVMLIFIKWDSEWSIFKWCMALVAFVAVLIVLLAIMIVI